MTDNIYIYPKKEDLEIIVGDEKQQDFKPRLKIKRWDNEVNFSVGVISAHAGTDSNISDNVEWDDGHGTKARFYEKEGDEFEFEIELASKPASNVLHLSIETKGLDFFYQPELTEKEKEIDPDTGIPKHMRPDNVVGSYAVYHSTSSGNIVGGNNYRAGKAFHIYRPYAIDSKGTKVWGDLNIEDDMKITIPQDFINNAVYPITIDPTFGCAPDDPGGSWELVWASSMIGSLFTTPSDIDTAQSVTIYMKYAGGGVECKGVIVLHSSLNIISNGIGGGEGVGQNTGAWETSIFSTDPSPATSTEHILMMIQDGMAYIAYASGSADQGHSDDSNSYASPQNLGSASHDNNKYSIYCTYEATAAGGGGGGILFNALSGPFVGPFGGPI